MRNGNGNGNGLHEWYDPAKTERLENFQRGKVVRPLSRRHLWIAAALCLLVAIGLLMVLAGQKDSFIFLAR